MRTPEVWIHAIGLGNGGSVYDIRPKISTQCSKTC